jgi:hypothetical protein
MDIDDKKLAERTRATKAEYKRIKTIRCPFFGEEIHFSDDGFKHMLYKGKFNKKKRDKSTQYMRLKLFSLACRLIKETKTLQEYYSTKHFVRVRNNKRREKVLKEVEYWAFIAIIKNRRIKVIIKQYESGDKKFWSVIPNWSIAKKRGSLEEEIINYSGNLESD